MSALVVIGVDPGSRVTGYGLVRELSGELSLVEAGTIRMKAEEELALRLARIYEGLSALVAKHAPAEAAVENVFVSHSAMSALKLGQARGAAIAALSVAGLPVSSYEPTLVKKSLVGVGRAEKSQVAFMVSRLLNFRDKLPADATDALAVAVCHLNQRRFARLAGK